MIRKRSSGQVTVADVGSGNNAITLANNNRIDFGSGANDHMYGNGTDIITPCTFRPTGLAASTVVANTYFQGTQIYGTTGAVAVSGQAANGASAVGVASDNTNALSTSGAKIHSFRNASVEKAFIDKDGQLENTVAAKGIILKSPDGTRYLFTIANGGTVSIVAA